MCESCYGTPSSRPLSRSWYYHPTFERRNILIASTDNTNADPETRAVWVQVARSQNIPIRCILFTASPKLCEHNDSVRAFNSEMVWFPNWIVDDSSNDHPQMNPEKRTKLPPVAFRSFVDRFRKPDLSEGFQDITPVDFKVCLTLHHLRFRYHRIDRSDQFHGTEEQQRIWSRYWVSGYST